jgi:hypothetical protein
MKAGTNPKKSNKDSCSTATERMSKWHCPSMNINLFLSPAHTNELLQTSLQNTNFAYAFFLNVCSRSTMYLVVWVPLTNK